MATTPRQFRLSDETLGYLDRISQHLSWLFGKDASRADAIRVAAKDFCRRLDRKKKSQKKSP